MLFPPKKKTTVRACNFHFHSLPCIFQQPKGDMTLNGTLTRTAKCTRQKNHTPYVFPGISREPNNNIAFQNKNHNKQRKKKILTPWKRRSRTGESQMDLISSRAQSFLGPSLIVRSASIAAAEEAECSWRIERLSWRPTIDRTENMFGSRENRKCGRRGLTCFPEKTEQKRKTIFLENEIRMEAERGG